MQKKTPTSLILANKEIIEKYSIPISEAVKRIGIPENKLRGLLGKFNYPLHSIDNSIYVPNYLANQIAKVYSGGKTLKTTPIHEISIKELIDRYKGSEEFRTLIKAHDLIDLIREENILSKLNSDKELKELEGAFANEYDLRPNIESRSIEDIKELISRSKSFENFYQSLPDSDKSKLDPTLENINRLVDKFKQPKCLENIHKILILHYGGKVTDSEKFLDKIKDSNKEIEINSFLNNYANSLHGPIIHEIVKDPEHTGIKSVMSVLRKKYL